MRHALLPAALLGLLAAPAPAGVTVADVFGDHMVIQAGEKVPVFGTTEPGGKVLVSPVVVTRGGGDADFSFAGQTTGAATAGDDGRWEAEIGPFESGAELILIVLDLDDAADDEKETAMLGSLKNPQPDTATKKVFTDVLAGDVWLCSGQSNMEWQLRNTLDGDREIKAAKDDEVRLFTVLKNSVREPQTELKDWSEKDEPSAARWVKLSPEAAAEFSAVGYYFGREIHEETGRPVGLINSSWGGTPSEAWTRESTLATIPEAEGTLKRWAEIDAKFAKGEETPKNWSGKFSPTHPHHPGNLNNGMIAPLVPFALKGAIWYQGESNASRAEQYDEIFPAMIADWRDQFGQKIPFFWVQLANFNAYEEDPNAYTNWAELREAQDNTLGDLPDVGQAVVIDVGEADDIHPRNKAAVGERLALAALETVYGMDEPGQLSPRVADVNIDGGTATVAFETDGDALQNRRDEYETAGPGDVLGFAVAGPDKTFYRAAATITGPNEVTVKAPAEVRDRSPASATPGRRTPASRCSTPAASPPPPSAPTTGPASPRAPGRPARAERRAAARAGGPVPPDRRADRRGTRGTGGTGRIGAV